MATSLGISDDKFLKGTCTPEEITAVSKKILPNEQRAFARTLGLTEQEILYLESTNSLYGSSEIPYQMLIKWQASNGSSATRETLINALRNIGKNAIAEEIFPVSSVICGRFLTDAQVKLRNFQKNYFRALQLPRSLWLKKKRLMLDELFVEPSMLRKSHVNQYINLEGLKKLFTMKRNVHYPRFLIEGHPGYGKTTLLLKLLSDWANKDDCMSQLFDLVFIIPLRTFTKSLEFHLHKQCRSLQNEEESREIIENTEERILIFLDSWDEASDETKISLMPLLRGIQYPNMTVVVTCRTGYCQFPMEDENCDELFDMESGGTDEHNIWKERFQLQGISPYKRTEFLKQLLKIDLNLLETKLVRNILKNNEVYQCPLFLLLLGVLILNAHKQIESVTTRTELYKVIFNFVVQKYLVSKKLLDKDQEFDIFLSENENSQRYRILLLKFGRVCIDKLKENIVTFNEDDILGFCTGFNKDVIIKSGLLFRGILFFEYEEKFHYEPVHKSFLEFLSAFYLSSLDELQLTMEVKELFSRKIRPTEDQLIYPFLGSLLYPESHKLFNILSFWKDNILMFYVSPEIFWKFNIQNLLSEISPTVEILKSLEPFLIDHLGYDFDFNFDPHIDEIFRHEFYYTTYLSDIPSVIFLQKWLTPLLQQLKGMFLFKYVAISANFIPSYLTLFPNDIVIENFVFVIFRSTTVEDLKKCPLFEHIVFSNLFFNVSSKDVINEPSVMNTLLSKFKFHKVSILINCWDKQDEYDAINRRIEIYPQFFLKEMAEGCLKHVFLDELSITDIEPSDFPELSTFLACIIDKNRITFGLKISFNKKKNIQFLKKELDNFCDCISKSQLKSFFLEVHEPVPFPVNIFANRKSLWKSVHLKGEFVGEENVAHTDYFSVEHFNLNGFKPLSLLPVIWSKCKNMKTFHCDDFENIAKLTAHDSKLAIETLEVLIINVKLLNPETVSAICNLCNLKELDIKITESHPLNIDYMLNIVSSLPSLKKLGLQFRPESTELEGFLRRLNSKGGKHILLEELLVRFVSHNVVEIADCLSALFGNHHIKTFTFTRPVPDNTILDRFRFDADFIITRHFAKDVNLPIRDFFTISRK